MLVWGSGFRSMGIDGTGPFLYNGERESIKKSSENSLLRRKKDCLTKPLHRHSQKAFDPSNIDA